MQRPLLFTVRCESIAEREWSTGLDYEKEFDEDVLRDVLYGWIAEEPFGGF